MKGTSTSSSIAVGTLLKKPPLGQTLKKGMKAEYLEKGFLIRKKKLAVFEN
ncbi:predicted protein [Coccidioides posadasii str. Silveira]|uniref:Predicted protein n=1 Tax=Coccidioides posadasii (strain RMSCC 757 / Silveira) TaxID=443226 RepID=E9D5X1_COCPS|nr:predicted protein [Coccidioides posadasii str. Silveira]